MTSEVVYKGGLRTDCTHVKSQNKIITDAPTDNHGKGEAFSPTDLVATALSSCMLTVMGIKAAQLGINIDGTTTTVNKVMAAEPRRISRVEIVINFPEKEYAEKVKSILEHTALNCPVAKSLSPDLVQEVKFVW